MDELRQTVARIDENVRLMRVDLSSFTQKVDQHETDIVIIKNDKKWTNKIVSALFGLIGVIIGALAEFLRK